MTRYGIYRHFKGGEYRVLHVAQRVSGDLPDYRYTSVVVYISLRNGQIYCRDEDEFNGLVESGGLTLQRFAFVHS